MSDSLANLPPEGEDTAASGPPVSLPAETLGRIRSLGLPVVLPDWIPGGFTVKKVTAERDPYAGPFTEVLLEGPSGAFVQVCVARAGVGDVFRGASRHSFDNPFFGSAALEWYDGDEEGVDFRSPWLAVSAEEFPALMVAGRGIPPEDAVRVAASLKAVTTRTLS